MFNVKNLQLNRGTTTSNVNGKRVITIHTYVDVDNSTAVIKAYLPPYLDQGAAQEYIGINDHILILGSDASILCKILSLNPFTVGPNLFSSGSGAFSVGATVVATDQNAAIISGDVLHMEQADNTHPGILTTVPQDISGMKSFKDGVLTPSLDTIAATNLQIGQNNATGATILKSNTTSLVSGITISSNNTVPPNNGIKYDNDGIVITGGASNLVLDDTGISSGNVLFLDQIESRIVSTPLVINPTENTSVSTFFFDKNDGIRFPSGGSGGGKIRNFRNDENLAVTWIGPWAASQPGIINIMRMNDNVILTVAECVPVIANHAAIITTNDLPPYVYPNNPVKGQVIAVSGGTRYYGSCTLDVSGILSIYTDLFTLDFSGLGFAGFFGFPLIYNINNA